MSKSLCSLEIVYLIRIRSCFVGCFYIAFSKVPTDIYKFLNMFFRAFNFSFKASIKAFTSRFEINLSFNFRRSFWMVLMSFLTRVKSFSDTRFEYIELADFSSLSNFEELQGERSVRC